MSTRAIAPTMGVTQQAAHKMVKRSEQVTTPVVTSTPDPLAEEKADGRVVKLTGPGSLLHSEPAPGHAERADPEGIDPPAEVGNHFPPDRACHRIGTP